MNLKGMLRVSGLLVIVAGLPVAAERQRSNLEDKRPNQGGRVCRNLPCDYDGDLAALNPLGLPSPLYETRRIPVYRNVETREMTIPYPRGMAQRLNPSKRAAAAWRSLPASRKAAHEMTSAAKMKNREIM